MSEATAVPSNAHRFSHEAMATIFEVAMIHSDATYAGQCAQAVFAEVDRLEEVLSRFLPNSDIAKVNTSEPGAAVVVGPDAFACLQHCERMTDDTGGAFDVTLGQMSQLLLYPDSHAVVRLSDETTVDLGGFGKGYAVDRIVKILKEWDIPQALVHGGSSSVMAMAAPPGDSGWRMTIRDPLGCRDVLQHLVLEYRAISGSGLRKGSHIVDPRSGRPAEGRRAAWALSEDAASGDALSTALMIMSLDEIQEYCHRHDDTEALVITPGPTGDVKVHRFGDLAAYGNLT
jgi:thiamine biosynthesis lipoprotein